MLLRCSVQLPAAHGLPVVLTGAPQTYRAHDPRGAREWLLALKAYMRGRFFLWFLPDGWHS